MHVVMLYLGNRSQKLDKELGICMLDPDPARQFEESCTTLKEICGVIKAIHWVQLQWGDKMKLLLDIFTAMCSSLSIVQ